MNPLDVITLSSFVPIVITIWLLGFIGNQMITQRTGTWAGRFAAGAFIAYALAAFFTFDINGAWDVVKIVVRAILAAGLMLSTSMIVLPALVFIYTHTIGEMNRRRAERLAYEERVREANERRGQVEQSALERKKERDAWSKISWPWPPPAPPAPPTREEIAAVAKAKYEKTLAIIEASNLTGIVLQAAKDKAEQDYVQEMNKVL